MEIILIFAGIVKLNPDWLRLQPLSMWLESRSDFPVLGYFFLQDWSVAIAAWGVILLHLVGAPLLLYKKTRLTVFCIYAAFHTLNHFVFSIGIFPWFTLFASLLFFDPDWPVRLKHKILSTVSRPEQQPPNSSTPDTIVSGEQHQNHSQPFFHHSRFQQKLVLSFLFFWTTSQILIPLRHLLYPGNVSWTEEGHRFSWQMKLRDKLGKTTFKVHDPVKKKTWLVNPSERLSRRQYRKMTTRPDMILQYAHFVAQHFKTQKGSTLNNTEQVEVRATVYVSLNGRKPALLIDPERDLARINRNLWHADWILPLTEPFRRFDKSG
jgi:hypothetical protein